jgi:multidrug efflux pump subunit AcrA (membrane-fusion protein)
MMPDPTLQEKRRMLTARWIVVSVSIICLLIGALLHAQEAPAPTTPPATAPATAPSAATHSVKKGRLALKIDAAGTFLPANPVEVRIRPEGYKGELPIANIAANGASVKKGDTLIQIDPADLNRELDAARNDLATAKANHGKAESDVALGEKGDALALKMAETAAKKGETDLKWWDDLTGPQMVQSTDLNIKQMAAYVDDQQDELDQLKKMYKTEDLTNATADIVLKRAVRQLEIGKITLKMQQDQAKKTKEYDTPQTRQPLEFAVEQAKQALEQLKATQAHGKITRQTALKSAQLALAAAEKRVADLEKDLAALTVAAPADGVVLYGQLAEGAFTPGDPKTLKPKEKLAAGQTVMVLFTPGSLRVGFDLAESKLAWVKQGMKAKVTPVAWPELSYDGTLAAPPPVGKTAGAEQTFPLSIDLSNVDPRIVPGMKATVKIDAGQGDEYPLVPASAVSGGKVKVKGKDGKEQERDVVTGRSDGQQVEIRQGLSEGEEIVTGAK